MKNRLFTVLIILSAFALQAQADFAFLDGADYTGEAFYEQSMPYTFPSKDNKENLSGTIPPIKRLRLNIKNKLDERALNKLEFAPTADTENNTQFVSDESKSEYISDETEEAFEEINPDGFEADNEALKESGKIKFGKKNNKKSQEEISKNAEDIILDCDDIDYDTQNYMINAKGNVSITFVKQNTTVKCDTMVFDRINNTIKADGNVKILKNGRTVSGDYIFVDLNEENALIENPLSKTESIEIRAKKGYVYGDKIVQENGRIEVNGEYPINLKSGTRGPHYSNIMITDEEKLTAKNNHNNVFKLKADTIKVKQKGDLEVISIKKGKVYKDNKTIFVIPSVKIYTNKNHDYAESNFWEVGYYRGLGLYTGPGWVVELPKGSVFKAMPVLNYYKGAGVGAIGRFNSGTNQTILAYGTASSKFFVSGHQDLDDNLFLQYSVNSYMDEWFLGRRRPKYGIGLVYKKSYSKDSFLLQNRMSSFSHRIETGYFHDLDFDGNFEKVLEGGNMGTMRTRYMAQAVQSLYNYKNPEKLKMFNFDVVGSLSTALYGTGDTQAIAMLGPRISSQYKRWHQQIGYNFVAYDDNSPMLRYDAYRYGTQFLYFRESFKLCRWLMLSWFSNINTTNDSIINKTLTENSFYLSFGPDEYKIHLGYDFAREIMRLNFEVMMDAKGSNVEYKTFELTQDKKSKKESLPKEHINPNLAPVQPQVLKRAIVEDMKVTEDVL
ncbi:MAG: hypothetical protein MJ230_03050 [bacterium]|nr:hypothetical protein [bacterium]